MRATRVESWDLFCRVVDNYGDIGVAWRLARQLASDARRSVRLYVDDLPAFARIEPRVNLQIELQIDQGAQCRRIDAIDVMHSRRDDWNDRQPADVVIELFGCGLPPEYLDSMVRADQPIHPSTPIWIDLEYLSAEAWVDDFHGRPSPHPTLPLVKHFFYPGFSEQSGGVLLEPALDEMRRAFIEDIDAVDALWRRLRVPPPAANERRASLFAYANQAAGLLFEAMASDLRTRWSVVVPEGVLSKELATFSSAFSSLGQRGSLSIHTIPFVAQDEYDRLLWSCDINFVRGEDSFMRAQWAARPFVWHIYPQADDAHLAKLNAFADRYETGLPEAVRDAQRALWHAWNMRGDGFATTWTNWCEVLPELSAHAEVWRQSLAAQAGLVDRLVAFVAERRASLLK